MANSWFQRPDDSKNTQYTGCCDSCGKGAYDDDAPELCRKCHHCATFCEKEKTKKENNGSCVYEDEYEPESDDDGLFIPDPERDNEPEGEEPKLTVRQYLAQTMRK